MKKRIMALLFVVVMICCTAVQAGAVSAEYLTNGQEIFREDFNGTLDEITANAAYSVGNSDVVSTDVADGNLIMRCKSNAAQNYFKVAYGEAPEVISFEIRYMITKATAGEGSVGCYLFNFADSRAVTNGNTDGTLLIESGVDNNKYPFEIKTEIGKWYSQICVLDNKNKVMSVYQKSDEDAEYTVVAENNPMRQLDRTVELTLLCENNSDAEVLFDYICIREIDLDYVVEVPAAETVTEESEIVEEFKAPQTLDTSIVLLGISCVCAFAGYVSKKKAYKRNTYT